MALRAAVGDTQGSYVWHSGELWGVLRGTVGGAQGNCGWCSGELWVVLRGTVGGAQGGGHGGAQVSRGCCSVWWSW